MSFSTLFTERTYIAQENDNWQGVIRFETAEDDRSPLVGTTTLVDVVDLYWNFDNIGVSNEPKMQIVAHTKIEGAGPLSSIVEKFYDEDKTLKDAIIWLELNTH